MALNKFENQIKERLEARRISPSPGSWDRLSTRLDEKENQGNSNKKWWLGIAAILIVAISIGGFLLKSNQSSTEPVIVDSPSENAEKHNRESILPSEEKNDDTRIASEENSETKKAAEKKQSENILYEQNDAKGKSEKLVRKQTGIALVDPGLAEPDLLPVKILKKDKIRPDFTKPSDTQVKTGAITSNDKMIQQKLDEVIRTLQAGSIDSVSDAEVNNLLLAAARELENEYQKDFTNTYSAEALLAEAEQEVEKSFRDKIFELLKEGYAKAKTAVALD